MKPLFKQIIAAVGAVFLLIGAAWLVLPMMVDTAAIEHRITQTVSQHTNLTLKVAGQTSVSLFPSPTITMQQASLIPANVVDGSQALVRAQSIAVDVGWAGVFSGGEHISQLLVHAPTIQWQMEKDTIDWPHFLHHLSGASLPMTVVVDAGQLMRPGTQQALVTGLSGQWRVQGDTRQVDAQFNLADVPHQLRIQTTAVTAQTTTPQPVQLSLESDVGKVRFNGDVRAVQADYLVQGKLHMDTPNLWALSRYWRPVLINAPEQPQSAAAEVALPLSVAGDAYYKAGNVVLKEMQVSSGETKGKIAAGFALHSPYNLQANAEFDTLDIAKTLALNWFGMRDISQVLRSDEAKAIAAKAYVKATTLAGSFKGKNLSFIAQMSDGAVTISDARFETAGEGKMLFKGAVTPSVQGPALSGNLSGEGKAFHAFLPAIQKLPFTLPDKGFGQFVFAAELRLTPEDFRISDFRARVEDTLFNGAYIEQFEKNDVGIRLALANLDMDNLLKAQTESTLHFIHKDAKGIDETLLLPPYLQEVLLGLTATNTINLTLQDYRYQDTPRDPLQLELIAARGQATLRKLSTRFNGTSLNVSGGVNVLGTTPQMTLYVSADDVDVNRFFNMEDDVKTASADGKHQWSNEPLNWNFIPRANMTIKTQIGKLHHPKVTLSNMRADLDVSDMQIRIKDFQSMAWGGAAIGLKGVVSGGSLPQAQLSLSVGNLELADARKLIPWLSNVTGRVSFSSNNITTNGASPLALAQNANGSLVVRGRSIGINQFGLKEAVANIKTLASADDLAPMLDKTLPSSNTKFDTLEASAFIKNGAISVPQLVVRNARYQGVMKGEGSLVDWTLRSAINFPLTELAAKGAPNLGFDFVGALDDVQASRRLGAVESYITDVNAKKLIQGN